jgi:hypothetical protein
MSSVHPSRFARIDVVYDGTGSFDLCVPESPDAGRSHTADTFVCVCTARISNLVGDFDSVAVSWEPIDGLAFPSFSGKIDVEPDYYYGSFRLVLTGRYMLPVENNGRLTDPRSGHRIASETARALLESMRAAIETSYYRAEKAAALYYETAI